jgi:hypothetical protein
VGGRSGSWSWSGFVGGGFVGGDGGRSGGLSGWVWRDELIYGVGGNGGIGDRG